MRAVPRISDLGRMGGQESVRFTIGGVAFMRHVADLLEPLKLTPSRSLALAFIDSHPGQDQTSLGKAMGMNRGSTMVLVDTLEKAGFVRRDPGPDRRSHALQLTPAGQAALEGALELNEQIMATIMGDLSPGELQTLSKIIDIVLERTGNSIDEDFPAAEDKKPAKRRRA